MQIRYKINNDRWKKYTKPIKIFNSSKIIAQEENSKRKEVATKNLEIENSIKALVKV